jgi:integrase
MTELYQEVSGDALLSQSFRAFSVKWLAKKNGEVAAATLSFYKKTVDKFLQFLGSRADEDINRITNADILKFRSDLSQKISTKTTNHNIKGLRMLFKAAREEQLINENPAESVKTLKILKKVERRPFTMDEVRSLLKHADDEWRSMIRFALYTGQRLADIATLRWENVDMRAKEIRLSTRKTGKALVLPIAPPLWDFLKDRAEDSSPHLPVHPNAAAIISKKEKSGQLSNQFSRIMALAGLRAKPTKSKKQEGKGRDALRHTERLSFHCFRHTAVTLLKEAGVPAAVVMELVGHDSEQMSAHYTHVGREAMEKAAKSLPKI